MTTIRKVDQDEAETIFMEESFLAWSADGILVILCAYCGSRNTVIVSDILTCEKCGADLNRGFVYLGKLLYPNEEIYLKPEE